METNFLSPDDQTWREVLAELPHDVYHLPEYLAHAARHERGTPVAFVATEGTSRMLVPLLLRPVPRELDAPTLWQDATSPYGYPGPLFQGVDCVDMFPMGQFWEAFRQALQSREVVSLFLRWHPFFPPPESFSDGTTILHGDTVYLDLRRATDELDAEVRQGHRYEIRRLANSGFQVVMNQWGFYEQFQQLYLETMHQVGARESYFFSPAYFADLQDLLGPALHLGCVLAPDGDLASASLFTETCGVVQYHLSATANAYRRMSPSKLLLRDVRDWAQQRGNRLFHLGGGLGGSDDSLFRFKAGFSKLRCPFFSSRSIIDQSRYAGLVARWRRANLAEDSSSDFFPRYRLVA